MSNRMFVMSSLDVPQKCVMCDICVGQGSTAVPALPTRNKARNSARAVSDLPSYGLFVPAGSFLEPFVLIASQNVLWCHPTRQSSLRFLASLVQADGNMMNRAAVSYRAKPGAVDSFILC